MKKQTIYFATVKFNKTVYTIPCGFTSCDFYYVMAETPELAEQKAKDYFKKKYDLETTITEQVIARKQNPESYIQLIK